MESKWGDGPARSDDALDELVYVSRLIGGDRSLVLAGGGNTSVKIAGLDEAGDVLHIKASGRGLADVDRSSFVPMDLGRLRRLMRLTALSDSDMTDALRGVCLVPDAPGASVESLMHAVLPHRFVLHSHADAFLAISNTADARARLSSLYGADALFVPYARSGLPLAKACAAAIEGASSGSAYALLLSHHGVVTWGDSAKEAYLRMVDLVARAERYLIEQGAEWRELADDAPSCVEVDASALASVRNMVSRAAGRPLVMRHAASGDVMQFARRSDLADLSQRGTVTPDHAIRMKPFPMLGLDVAGYAESYSAYFKKHADSSDGLTMKDPAPRVVLDPALGMLAFGVDAEAALTVERIYRHTIRMIEASEQLGGYCPLDAARLFSIEYWAPKQIAKLARVPVGLGGQVAFVVGAGAGVGKRYATWLLAQGVAVCGVDVLPNVQATFSSSAWLGVQADVKRAEQVEAAANQAVERFGGIDLVGVWAQDMDVPAVQGLLHKLEPVVVQSPARARVLVMGLPRDAMICMPRGVALDMVASDELADLDDRPPWART